ncbi:MAG: LysR family transcriptional regulator [Gomphosphaeria aponina SAG 52.96 = DSM 107014]|uniref:LysR family transcriptional regulator n=1 Tax=Gomphosphaeria aponina SAG 52.96 = DSM 107014 TaxID=1521640 RepID=A0A941GVB5_9CHRO|nr:LysR family transcriptional regulator [Gomphosphaeria aponina SAG 52.96 = DSM 107014]
MIQATLHQLVVFEAVARHGSFTRAAEELSITQPTVSSQIKQLSSAVGLPLFEQIGKRLYLTDAGKELVATCQDMFEKLQNFEMKMADLKGTKQGSLSLAVITTAKYFVPRLLGRFCQKYPGIDVSLTVINHQEITRRMLENQDDLYILSQPPAEIDLCTQAFLDNPLVVVAPRDHPLAREKNIPIKKLNGEAFIMREQGSGTRSAVHQLFAKHKIDVKVKLELGSNEAIKQAIAGGLGISVLSEHTLIWEGPISELTILDVQHFPIERRWYVTHLGGKQLSVIATAFKDYLIEECNKIPTHSSKMFLQV